MAENTDKPPTPPAATPKVEADPKPDTPVSAAAEVTEQPDASGEKKPDGEKDAAAKPAAPAPTIEQSLEEGIGQIAKGFGSLWGVMKARSANTLTQLQSTAERTYAQLQEDVRVLQETKVEVGTKDSAQWEAEQAEAKAEAAAKKAAEAAEPIDVKGKGKARDPAETPSSPTASSPIADAEATARSLLSRLTTSTSALQSQLRTSLNTTVASARASGLDDPAALRARLAENLRLSELKLSLQQAEKLAESYVAKGRAAGEAWVHDAEKWVEENVKVVPPEQAVVPSGGWDAGEWYAFSTSDTPITPSGPGAGGPSGANLPAGNRTGVAGSRKDALLARLRTDTDLLLVDPGAEPETEERREQFAAWVNGNKDRIAAEKEKEMGHVGEIRMALVPEHIDDETFWTRYLFHRDMIEEGERRRKELLMATTEEDDFTWDDDDDEQQATPTDSTIAPKKDPSTPVKAPEVKPDIKAEGEKAPAKGTEQLKADSKATSPRDSEESYDVVSGRTTAAQTEDDDDSDWE